MVVLVKYSMQLYSVILKKALTQFLLNTKHLSKQLS